MHKLFTASLTLVAALGIATAGCSKQGEGVYTATDDSTSESSGSEEAMDPEAKADMDLHGESGTSDIDDAEEQDTLSY